MRKLIGIVIAFVVMLCAIMVAKATADHRCTDSTHATCDGVCECDGFGCQ